MFSLVHQYAYFFSLLLFILPVSLIFDASIRFKVIKKLTTLKGLVFILISVIFWSLFDVFWIHTAGAFPANRTLFTIGGVPIEEMLLFVLAFYSTGVIFVWAKEKYP